MKVIYGNLAQLMEEQQQIYQELMQLAKGKREFLIKGSLEELDRLIKSEEALIYKIGKLEEERHQKATQLMAALGLESDATLAQLLERVEGPEKIRLEKAFQELTGLLTELAKLNEENTSLIQQSLRYVNFTIDVLTQQEKKTTYNPEQEKKPEAVSRLLDRKV